MVDMVDMAFQCDDFKTWKNKSKIRTDLIIRL